MNLPSDPRKGVYILEAYHYLHCLVCQCHHHMLETSAYTLTIQRTLRMTLREAVEQKAYYTYSPAQTDYCFDTLGQVYIPRSSQIQKYRSIGLTLIMCSTSNATPVPPPSTHLVITPQAKVSCTGARIGLSFAIL